VAETNGLTVTKADQAVDNDANDILISSATGTIAVVVMEAGAGATGDVTLTAVAGAVTDANGATLNITADVLSVDAVTGVGSANALETTVASIDIDNSTSGNIEIAETDGLTVTKADQAVDNDANDILISSATGTIAVVVMEAGAGVSGDVTLTAVAGAVTDANGATLNITADVLTIDAVTGVGATDSIETAIEELTVNNTVSGGVDINDTTSIAVNAVTASGQTVTLGGGSGALTDNNGGSNNITASLLVVSATTGIDLDTTISTLTATNTSSGDIDITDVDSIALNAVSAGGQTVLLTSTAGALTDNNAGATNVTATTLEATAATGIDMDTSVAAIDADTAGGNIDINNAATTGVTIESMNTAGAATIVYAQSGNQALEIQDVTTTNGNITISNSGGTGSNIDIDSGAINSDTADDIVSITAAGAINDDSGDNTTDISAFSIDLNAGTGIGNTAALDLEASTISADSTSGEINLNSNQATNFSVTSLTTTGAPITFTQLAQDTIPSFTTIATSGGFDVTLNSPDGIAVNGTVSNVGGNIVINADTDPTAGEFVGTLSTGPAGVLTTGALVAGDINLTAVDFSFSGTSTFIVGLGTFSLAFSQEPVTICLGSASDLACATGTQFDNSSLAALASLGNYAIDGGSNVILAEDADLGGVSEVTFTASRIDDVGTTPGMRNAGELTLTTTTNPIGGSSGNGDGLTIDDIGELIIESTGGNNVTVTNLGATDTTYTIGLNDNDTITPVDDIISPVGDILLVQQTNDLDIYDIATDGNLTANAITGSIVDNDPSAPGISVAGLADLTAGTDIILGEGAATLINLGSLTFNSSGNVTVIEDDGMLLTGTSTAGSAKLHSTGGTLTNTASADLQVTGNATFASAGGTTLGRVVGDNMQFGSLTVAGATTIIEEDDATVLSNTISPTTTVVKLDLKSALDISDDGTANLTVLGDAILADTGGAGIVLNDFFDFTNLSFTSTGTVNILDQGGVDLVGVSGAVTLTLASTGNITDTGTVLVLGNTTLTATGANILLNSSTNNFDTNHTGDSLTASAANITVSDADDLILATITATTNLIVNVDAGADETVSLDLRGATITAGGVITLNGNGTNDTLFATDTANLWTITEPNSGNFNDGIRTFNFTSFGNITGGGSTDTFNFTSGTISGLVDGGANVVSDTLSYAGGPAATITLTAQGTIDGFKGTATSLGQFDDIDVLTGSGGIDTLAETITAAGTFTVQSGSDTFVSGNTLNFSGIENLTAGGGNDSIVINEAQSGNLETVGAGDFTITLNASLTGNINGGTGDDTINFNSAMTGNLSAGEGDNILDFNSGSSAITGSVTITGNDIWHHVNGQTLATGAVTGSGTLTIPNETSAPSALTVGTSNASDLFLPNLGGFTGGLIIGGTMDPPTLPFDGNTTIAVNTANLNINDTVLTSGDVSILAHNIFLDVGEGDSITTGSDDTIFLFATGTDPAGQPPQTGVITTRQNQTSLTAGSGIFITTGSIQDAFKIVLNFDAGDLQTSVGDNVDPAFGTGSNFTSEPLSAETSAFLETGGITIPGASSIGAIVLSGLTQQVTATQAILASNLIGLQQIGFIDTSLFEEELSLYGVIGRGIALALAQCEELEGCAPNVTDEELSQLIASIEGRIVELEQRLAETENEADKATLEELLAGFRQELENYLSYRDQLAEYTSGEDEEDLGEDSFGEEAPAPADTVAGDVERLTRILEVTRERINWLESLKANPEERARLGEATSIDLTEEALDEIIDATRREAESLESQIRLLQDGTEARHPMPDEKPEFWAEAGDVFNILHVQYGPSLASAGDGIVTASELRY
jgi:hypothetical protein